MIEQYENIYCSNIGIEYFYIMNNQEKEWLIKKLENSKSQKKLDSEELKRIYFKLSQAENFEKFLSKKYIGKKKIFYRRIRK